MRSPATSPRGAEDRRGGAVDVGLGRRPVRHRDAHRRRRASACRRPSRSRPPARGRSTSSVTASFAPKRTSTWLRTTSLRTSTPSAASEPRRQPPRQRAAPLDQLRDAAAPERPQRRVDREPARAPRRLRHPVEFERVGVAAAHEVGGGHAHRRAWASRSRTATTPQSYGTLSHLWASVAHESASPAPAARLRERRARRRPQPERAVDVHPGAVLARCAPTISASGSNAPVFTLPACAQTIVGPVAGRAAPPRARRRASAPCPSTGDDLDRRAPNPSSRSARHDGHVRLVADDHARSAARR